ncbi:hypothetical protein KDA_47390 [Dictyobacter alpinus]|uniref:HTH tetR-type domain-containing protein n=1 Tax=Dictyobacter alpinus TaxID=2014873 RepID=A0A402BD19_9CHLR|nr:TetR family transcriptional regulator [Dictyobacter alpinus]GCE29255.1 hypothetical protein KDA_47390 [Dictyobacter alpinus]
MATPPKNVDLRAQRTRQLLWQAFLDIMQEKGFTAMSIQEITERANVHRGTFYAHFADKYALLEAILREEFRDVLTIRGEEQDQRSFFRRERVRLEEGNIHLCSGGGMGNGSIGTPMSLDGHMNDRADVPREGRSDMAKLVFGMNQCIDGYVDHMRFGPTSPTPFRHFIEEAQLRAGSIYGRQVYELMRSWDDDHPEWDAEKHGVAEPAEMGRLA